MKCFQISDLNVIQQNRQLLVTQISHYHSLSVCRIDKENGKAVVGLLLNNKHFPYKKIDSMELDANFTQESFTLRKFFVSSDQQYALLGNIKYAYKPGATVHHWETTIMRVSVENFKLKAEVLPPIEIFNIYQLDVYPCSSADQKRVFMPYFMRGNGGAASGPASYTNELFCEVFCYDLETNQISKIKERFVFQDLLKQDAFYMEQFRAQNWTSGEIPMRMAKGSIVQMSQYDNHHYVYYDLVDEWLKPAEFPFLIDWRMDDNGNFLTFSRQVIEQERAIGVQRLSQASHRSFVSCNMFDQFSLAVTYYIGNSCIPYIGTAGKKLTKLVE